MKQKKNQQPIDCVLGITYNCNSRCKMCYIWKIKDFPQIAPAEYAKLPTTLKDINISGGEPFLRNDIIEIVQTVVDRCPRARIVISTNGFMPVLIERQMKKILAIKPDIGVAISIDGYKEMHEQMRCIPDAWNKCIDTLERLQALGMTNLRLAFTVTPENIGDFTKVYDETVKRGVQFTHAFAQSSEHFFGGIQIENNPNSKTLADAYRYVIEKELASWSVKRWLRAYFTRSMYIFYTQKEQALSNDPGVRFFYLDPRGDIYPSVVHNVILGNITTDAEFDTVWKGKKAQEGRHVLQEKKQPAWMICTARSAMKKHIFSVGWWIMRHKFFSGKVL